MSGPAENRSLAADALARAPGLPEIQTRGYAPTGDGLTELEPGSASPVVRVFPPTTARSPLAAAIIAPPTVTVILPVYNEAGLIDSTLASVELFALENPNYTFVFVDDGSSDGTAERIQQRLLATPAREQLQLLSYSPNRGKGHAIRAGASAAATDLMLFTDGDLAYPLEHLPVVARALETHDVVIGSRSLVEKGERNTSTPRKIMGWTFNKCAKLMLGLPYRDTQAGLKGFRADAARLIFDRQRLSGFAFDVELVYIARRMGLSVGEVPARVSEEHSYKRTKVHLLRDPARMFWALVDVRINAALGLYGARRR
jgi:dolichyl-phosphate beta-glucosyltransferase